MTRVRYKVPFGKSKAEVQPGPKKAPVPRVARMLALAYYVDRLVEAGELKSYGEAARRLGITDARITQIMDLTLLAPRIQEGILDGSIEINAKRAQGVAREVVWEGQRRRL